MTPSIFFSPIEQRRRRGGGGRGGGGGCDARFFFSCLADHERDWLPCKVVFRVGNQYTENVENNKKYFKLVDLFEAYACHSLVTRYFSAFSVFFRSKRVDRVFF